MPPKLGFAAGIEAIGRLGTAALTIAKEVSNYWPVIEDEVVVEVTGQPGADKRSLYLLAMAAANGIVRRNVDLLQVNPALPPVFGLLQIEYDASDNWVRCTQFYRYSAVELGSGVWSANRYDLLAVYNGPQCSVVGGPFQFTDRDLPGVPSSPATKNIPTLPFKGRTILTSCPEVKDPVPLFDTGKPVPSLEDTSTTQPVPSPNPKPPGDNRSRGSVVRKGTVLPTRTLPDGAIVTTDPSVTDDRCSDKCPKQLDLVPLVYAALTDPGSFGLETFPVPKAGPKGT